MMRQHLADHPGHGFKTMFHQCLAGKVGQVRAGRLYAAHHLQLFHRNTSRVYPRFKVALAVPPQTDHTWSMDFMYCHCPGIHKLRALTVLDDFSRECLAIQGGQGRDVTWLLAALTGLLASRGVPKQIRCDNGPEFRSAAFHNWAAKQGITILHTAPYRPYQNGYIERFNLTLRVDFLNWHRSTSLATFQAAAERYRYQYNHDRPHQRLGWLTPAAYADAHRPLLPAPAVLLARTRRTTRWGTKKGKAPIDHTFESVRAVAERSHPRR